MATISRRSEAPQHSHQNPKRAYRQHLDQQHQHQHQQQQQSQQQQQQQQLQQQQLQQLQSPEQHHFVRSPVTTRTKRPLGLLDNLADPLKAKKTRIAVEIFAKPLSQTIDLPKPILLKHRLSTAQPVPVASSHKAQRHSPIAANRVPPVLFASDPVTTTAPPTHNPAATSTATSTTTSATTSAATTTVATTDSTPSTTTPATTITTATSGENGRTRHKEKVINGIRHELDRLQPNADTSAAADPPGRKLRSQQATRFKSELSAYFPEYDEVIGNDPKEQHLLNNDTPIIIHDTEHGQSDPLVSPANPLHSHPTDPHASQPRHSTVREYSDSLFTDLHNSQITIFDPPPPEHSDSDSEDPLPDSQFTTAHKKAQRLEKSIRNTERGRAQHEKDRIVRLLGELQGHDWLRTMGVSGVTESRRKSFEPARDHFIKGCQAILDKFRLWTQEEKRRKLEKERALHMETDEEDAEDTQPEADTNSSGSVDTSAADDVDMMDAEEEDSSYSDSEGDESSEYSDVDAAERQLHDEAMQRATYAASSSNQKTQAGPPPATPTPGPKPRTSFFKNKPQRDAALNKRGLRGKPVLAFGHPIPEVEEREFDMTKHIVVGALPIRRERLKRSDRRQRRE
ncbi:hypothetical protein GGR50DRAFT_648890 [Xylaria sp. CBS 124048]|nr:hypothetical protein GGR50DRAFT_648890 [Xylaria sp. CBS 124048]